MRYTYSFSALVLCFFMSNQLCGQALSENKLFILIHGTWAADSEWHLPGGEFFDTLEKSACAVGGHVIPYNWSGNLSHESRIQAARGLAKLIQSFPPSTVIHLIGHSHGGNVAVSATKILARDVQNVHRIATLYTLATPIDDEDYFPDMDIVGHVYNLFSFNDRVQPVLGFFGREYQPHDRIANIKVIINGYEPRHGTLHHPIIAKWLPLIPNQLAESGAQGFQFFSCKNPGIIHFHHSEPPYYRIDLRSMRSEQNIEQDQDNEAEFLFKKDLLDQD